VVGCVHLQRDSKAPPELQAAEEVQAPDPPNGNAALADGLCGWDHEWCSSFFFVGVQILGHNCAGHHVHPDPLLSVGCCFGGQGGIVEARNECGESIECPSLLLFQELRSHLASSLADHYHLA